MSDTEKSMLLVSMFTITLVAFIFNALAFMEARRHGDGSLPMLIVGGLSLATTATLMTVHA